MLKMSISNNHILRLDHVLFCKQDPNLCMASLDVDSLFTNIPLDKAIDICIDFLYNNNENTPKISKDVFCNLLNIAIKESLFYV